jgi:mono/diheme cytochrome c family protein
MLVALTSEQVGLAVVASIFIAFAVAVAIVIPRSRPDFPGNRLGLFILVTVLLFLAMITAVVVFAGEEESEGHEATPTETLPTETGPAETGGTTTGETTETGETETGEAGATTTSETETGAEGGGDATAGKTVFTSAGCVSCHTLADAGATGTVGPNLDEAKPSHDKVVERVTNGKGVMPSFKGQLTEQQIQDVAAYVSSVAGQ